MHNSQSSLQPPHPPVFSSPIVDASSSAADCRRHYHRSTTRSAIPSDHLPPRVASSSSSYRSHFDAGASPYDAFFLFSFASHSGNNQSDLRPSLQPTSHRRPPVVNGQVVFSLLSQTISANASLQFVIASTRLPPPPSVTKCHHHPSSTSFRRLHLSPRQFARDDYLLLQPSRRSPQLGPATISDDSDSGDPAKISPTSTADLTFSHDPSLGVASSQHRTISPPASNPFLFCAEHI